MQSDPAGQPADNSTGPQHHGAASKARGRYVNAFLLWLEAAEPKLLVKPRILRRRETSVQLKFEGMTERLVLEIWEKRSRSYSPESWYQPDKDWLDPKYILAVYVDPWPYTMSGRANCLHGHNFEEPLQIGLPEAQTNKARHALREAIWQAKLFEPFLQWANECLAKADALIVAKAERHRAWVILEEEGLVSQPWTTELAYDLHHHAFLAWEGALLSAGDPTLVETIDYVEIVAVRTGKSYFRGKDGRLTLATPPADGNLVHR